MQCCVTLKLYLHTVKKIFYKTKLTQKKSAVIAIAVALKCTLSKLSLYMLDLAAKTKKVAYTQITSKTRHSFQETNVCQGLHISCRLPSNARSSAGEAAKPATLAAHRKAKAPCSTIRAPLEQRNSIVVPKAFLSDTNTIVIALF